MALNASYAIVKKSCNAIETASDFLYDVHIGGWHHCIVVAEWPTFYGSKWAQAHIRSGYFWNILHTAKPGLFRPLKKLKLKQKTQRKKLASWSHLTQIRKNLIFKAICSLCMPFSLPNISKNGKILEMVLIFLKAIFEVKLS